MFEGQSLLVIGGEGFLGHRLIELLVERYPQANIASLDIVQRHFPEKEQWTFYSADLTSLESLTATFSQHGANVVFHTASPWTGSGAEVCEKVNVQGTKTIVEACIQNKVGRLVFTSSAGTVYDGVDLINVDERMPFPKYPIDAYNETKAKAEQIVLEANGKDGLLTVAIRPAGIFGPGDRQAVPGVMEVLKTGKTKFQVGSNENLFDWTYVDNVVHAHLLAAEKLADSVSLSVLDERQLPVSLSVSRRQLPTSTFRPASLLEREQKLNPTFENATEPDPPLPSIRNRYDPFANVNIEQTCGDRGVDRENEKVAVAGQAYFVTNGEPIAFWDFPRAVWHEYNGHVAPWVLPLPAPVGLMIAGLAESVMKLMGKTPNMTQGKIVYSTVNRFYNIEKARRILGYEPIVGFEEGVKRAVAWYKANEASAKPIKA